MANTVQFWDMNGTECIAGEEMDSVTRLFIGNLVPAISNSALEASLSKFGIVKDLIRNADRNFAHASLTSRSAKDVDKCLSVLNQTRWFGTVLRVEVATEHFKVRLEKEWAEEAEQERQAKLAALAVRRELQNSSATKLESGESQSEIPDRFSWKGKRTTFYRSENAQSAKSLVPAGKPSKNGADRDLPPRTVADAGKANSMAPREEVTPNAGVRQVSTSVTATLDLFGLCVEEPEPIVSGDKERTSEPTPAKRARGSNVAAAAADRAAMIAIENDPSKIDVPAEKDLARSIFEKIFPDGSVAHVQKKRLDEAVARHRRKALYRRLVSGDAAIEEEVSSRNTTVVGPRFGGKEGRAKTAIEKNRRKGLYKDLLVM